MNDEQTEVTSAEIVGLAEQEDSGLTVGLFATCLVDLLRPSVGFAAVELLERAGCRVEVPAQTCCGQPNYNNGDTEGAAEMALRTARDFAHVDYVVVPSGSCAAMMVKHYPSLYPEGSKEWGELMALSAKTRELTVFLREVSDASVVASLPGKVAYHDGCSGYRELKIFEQPRALLKQVDGLTLCDDIDPEVCCGFGGTFCVRYPAVASKITDNKCDEVLASGADYLVSGDLGCLLNLAGRLEHRGEPVAMLHVAEVLAGHSGSGGENE